MILVITIITSVILHGINPVLFLMTIFDLNSIVQMSKVLNNPKQINTNEIAYITINRPSAEFLFIALILYITAIFNQVIAIVAILRKHLCVLVFTLIVNVLIFCLSITFIKTNLFLLLLMVIVLTIIYMIILKHKKSFHHHFNHQQQQPYQNQYDEQQQYYSTISHHQNHHNQSPKQSSHQTATLHRHSTSSHQNVISASANNNTNTNNDETNGKNSLQNNQALISSISTVDATPIQLYSTGHLPTATSIDPKILAPIIYCPHYTESVC